jgi:hypothetical protein
MVVVLFKPLWLTRLHAWLAGAVVHISGALHHAGAGGRVIDAGVCITQPCLLQRVALAPECSGQQVAAP